MNQKFAVLQTKGGMFLKFMIDEVPQKKKAAVGVRGMKLAPKDELEEVYFVEEGVLTTGTYNGREIELNRLKLARRDTKGTKMRS